MPPLFFWCSHFDVHFFSFISYNFKTPIKINNAGNNRISNVELKKIPRKTRKNPKNVIIALLFIILLIIVLISLFIQLFITCFLLL